jgi:hypothetical protein
MCLKNNEVVLKHFVSICYVKSPQIIAQAFCLRFKEYGKTDAVEDVRIPLH